MHSFLFKKARISSVNSPRTNIKAVALIYIKHRLFSEAFTEEKFGRILKYLPEKLSGALEKYCAGGDGGAKITEIRLRSGAPASVTENGKNIFVFSNSLIICTPRELAETLARLCEDSIHTYSETIKQGYAVLDGGYRIGIIGSARSDGEAVRGIYQVSSLCIRIPHAVRGVCRDFLGEIRQDGRIMSALVYSPPGVGKTTLLRETAAVLSSGAGAKRICIIDTRGEIYMKEMFGTSIADVLFGYPRSKGMEIATRTMSAEVIICDEIGTAEETEAILSVQNGGVPLIASAHAESFNGLMRRPNIKKLADAGIFEKYIGLSRNGGEFLLEVNTL